jgi:single-stranded-DNA-specific exonuclease
MGATMGAHWRLRPHDRDAIEGLARGTGLHPLVCHLLINRGVREPEAATRFLEAKRNSFHDPELLPGAAEAAERLVAAIRDGRKIVVYGDYDVDGVCGTTILWTLLKLAGARDVGYYIPSRFEEGYGLNGEALRRLAAEEGAEVVVTVDCGVTAIEEAKLARELGLELIVTDHHAMAAELPAADVVVHPRRPGGAYPFGDLCGAGVAFKVAWQVAKSFGDGKKASPHMRDFLLRALNLVALATVADVVPLEDENRVFVRHGLRGLKDDPSHGLRSLIEVAGCTGHAKLNTGHLGFQLAPRINAAGRMECAMLAVKMLITEDPAEALELAVKLDLCNKQRQEQERATTDEAKALIEQMGGLGDHGALVLAKEGWHPGVVGIVAGRLADWYSRPTLVLTILDGVAQGSARSVPGFDLVAALRACSEGLTKFGGHAAAAGLKLPAERFPEFAERFDAFCRGALTEEQRRKQYLLDAEIMLGELSPRVVREIEGLEPYGMGNPRPLLLVERAKVVGTPATMGAQNQHLRFRVAQGSATLNAVGWGMAGRWRDLRAGATLSLAFEPEINEWNGRSEVRLNVKDVQVHPGEEAVPRGALVPAGVGPR